MKAKWTVALVVAIMAAAASAQDTREIVRTGAADLRCVAGGTNEGTIYEVTNASTNVDCDTTPEPVEASRVSALCLCSGGTFVALVSQEAEAPDLSAYAALQGADFTGPVTVDIDHGEGTDETLLVTGLYGETTARLLVGGEEQAVALAWGDNGFYASQAQAGMTLGQSAFQLSADDSAYIMSGYDCLWLASFRFCGAMNYNPYNCATGAPGQYFDTDDGEICFCDGVGPWAPVDAASSAACTTPE